MNAIAMGEDTNLLDDFLSIECKKFENEEAAFNVIRALAKVNISNSLSEEEQLAAIATLEERKGEVNDDREKIELGKMQITLYRKLLGECIQQEASTPEEFFRRAENECSDLAKKVREIYAGNMEFARIAYDMNNEDDAKLFEALRLEVNEVFHGIHTPGFYSISAVEYALLNLKVRNNMSSLSPTNTHNASPLTVEQFIQARATLPLYIYNRW